MLPYSKGTEPAFVGEYTYNNGSGTNFKNLSYVIGYYFYKPS